MRILVVVGLLVACKREPAPEPERRVVEPPRDAIAEVVVDARTGPACNAEYSAVCVGDDVVECTRTGALGKVVQSCKAGCKRGACVETCAAKDIELIYGVDDDKTLYSFDPRKLPNDPFAKIGVLDCVSDSTPFSMAVDNHGIGWVLYDDDTLFRVSILDGHCARKGSKVTGAPSSFGMGFVSYRGKDTLYVADDDDERGKRQLATVDTVSDIPSYTAVGEIMAQQTVNPELTGTSDDKLFGYFPEPGRGFVAEIDRKSGRLIGSKKFLPDIGGVDGYAFAHWGGTFYIFAGREDNRRTAVHAIDRKTGAYRLILEHTKLRIVGAGVSTCAPLVERAP
jgi:hypothetical protein